jgi:OOP family OmpA-OmpF porin
MKFIFTLRTILIASVGALATYAQAQEGTYTYFGLAAGQSHSQLNELSTTQSLLGAGSGAAVVMREQQDTAYKVFVGRQFSRNFGLEAGYFNLGKFSFGSTSPTGTLNGQYQVEGVNVDLIGTAPLSDSLALFGRIGAQYANTRGNFAGTGPLISGSSNPSKYDTNLKVGLGVQYDITSSLQLRAEAERYRINDSLDNRGDVNVFSISVVFPYGRQAERTRVTSAPNPYVAPAPMPSPPPPVVIALPIALAVEPAPAPVRPVPRSVRLSADSLFSFDKSIISTDGKSALDAFARDTRGVTFDGISVVGNTDRLGGAAYNQKLSEQRAEAVKVYLASSSELRNTSISASGKGESNPVTKSADCVGNKPTKALIACLQPDRRVDVEMSGSR